MPVVSSGNDYVTRLSEILKLYELGLVSYSSVQSILDECHALVVRSHEVTIGGHPLVEGRDFFVGEGQITFAEHIDTRKGVISISTYSGRHEETEDPVI